jgi:alpha-tubulin suppressor-like RCC1 family protein
MYTLPQQVNSLFGVLKVRVSDFYHVCALDFNGSVSCWGSNAEGQLGDGTRIDRWVPKTVRLF